MRILGEQPLPSSAPARPPPGMRPPPGRPPPKTEARQFDRPTLTSKEATQPGVFQPYAKDPTKEARYHAFLDGRDYDASFMDPWDQERELGEFVKSALLYRPMHSAIASRFAHGSGEPAETNGAAAAGGKAAEAPKSAKDAKANAVKLKLFGALTREHHEWHPSSLVCKRFDVPDPYPKSGLVGLVRGTKKAGLAMFMPAKAAAMLTSTADQALPAAFASSQAPTAEAAAAGNAAVIDAVPNVDVPQLPPRPAMDIFKAIFSDSSSDDSDSDGDGDGDGGGAAVPTAAPAATASAPPPLAIAPPAHAAPTHTPVGPPPMLPPTAPPPPGGPPAGSGNMEVAMPRPMFRKPGGGNPSAASAAPPEPALDAPPAAPKQAAAPKLTLVHTYDDLKDQQRHPAFGAKPASSAAAAAGVSSLASRAFDNPQEVAPQWVEKPAKRKHKSKDKSKDKKKKHKSKKKKKKGKHKSSSKLSFDASDSESDDSDSDGRGSGKAPDVHQALLATMKAMRQTHEVVLPMPEPRARGQGETITFECPNDKVGLVIGRGGSLLKELTEKFLCKIAIAKPDPNNPDQPREVTITGQHDKIALCHKQILGRIAPWSQHGAAAGGRDRRVAAAAARSQPPGGKRGRTTAADFM